ncbi:transposase [Mycolicibacterium goodii]|uniref:transposase n=1 Tax=Mycolicibacterium goodii TaxID=134601 RepID=UPI00296E59A5
MKTWPAEQPSAFREQVEVIAMDGFGGYKTAAADELPEATAVMDPFHVVALAGTKLDLIRQRIQQATCGHRGRTGDPLYGVRRTLRTRFPLLTSRQRARIEAVFADDNHLGVQRAWSVYQRIIAAYGHPDRRRGKTMMTAIIDSLRRSVPAALEELAQLGRTLHRRRADILAFFDHHTSNGPTEAINGRLEALRRNALGFLKPHPIPTALTTTQRRPAPTGQCTLNYEEPVIVQIGAWQAGQHQLGSLAATVVAYDMLVYSIGQQSSSLLRRRMSR